MGLSARGSLDLVVVVGMAQGVRLESEEVVGPASETLTFCAAACVGIAATSLCFSPEERPLKPWEAESSQVPSTLLLWLQQAPKPQSSTAQHCCGHGSWCEAAQS